MRARSFHKYVLSGFTLIELLIVTVTIATLAMVVFVALNPAQRLQSTRNAKRNADVHSLITAIQTYTVDNLTLPAGLSPGMTETQLGTCPANTAPAITTGGCNIPANQACVDLSVPLARYLKSIPQDPNTGSSVQTRYSVSVDTNGNIAVNACGREGLATTPAVPTSTPPLPTNTPIPTNTPTPVATVTPTPGAGGVFQKALRFYGNGTGDIDRVKISIDNPQTTADIGATDFTLEFWIKANAADNIPTTACASGNDGWITGNIVFDRDIWGSGDYGDFGISLFNGRVAFGINNGTSGANLCGATSVANGVWHHVAVTRRTTGQMAIYVDGLLDASMTGPTGDLSYRNGRVAGMTNDPYLVIGAEKHDYDPSNYPPYDGHIDEVRLSNTIRYSTNFTRPSAPFTSDAQTLALYHFNEGSGTAIGDASGNNAAGVLRFGGSPQGPVFVDANIP